MADDDKDKLQVWGTGLFGVNVVDGPLHLVDGELLAAQNAEPFTEEGEGGIRKRLGIGLFTGATLGFPITAITSIPLVDNYPTFRRLVALISGSMSASPSRTSTNGTSWSNLSGLTTLDRWEPANGYAVTVPSYNGVLYYPVSNCTGMQTYNGIGVAAATPLPQTITALSRTCGIVLVLNAVVRDGFIWWAVRYTAGGSPASVEVVFKHDPVDGSFTQIGSPFSQEAAVGTDDGIIAGLEVWQGKVYVQTNNQLAGTNGQVWSITPGEAAWTLEDTIASNPLPGGLAAAEDGGLYAGWSSGSAGRLRKLATPGGTWSNAIAVGAAAWVVPVHVAGDRVLCWVSTVADLRLKESLNAGVSFADVYTEADPVSPSSTGMVARLVRLGAVEFLTYGDFGANVSKIIRNSSGWSVVESYGASPESAAFLSGV